MHSKYFINKNYDLKDISFIFSCRESNKKEIYNKSKEQGLKFVNLIENKNDLGNTNIDYDYQKQQQELYKQKSIEICNNIYVEYQVLINLILKCKSLNLLLLECKLNNLFKKSFIKGETPNNVSLHYIKTQQNIKQKEINIKDQQKKSTN